MWVAGAAAAAVERTRRLLYGNEAAAAEDALVDAAVAAAPKKLLGREAVCGGLQVAVIELLDSGCVCFLFQRSVLLGFLVLLVISGGGVIWGCLEVGITCEDCSVCSAGEVSHSHLGS